MIKRICFYTFLAATFFLIATPLLYAQVSPTPTSTVPPPINIQVQSSKDVIDYVLTAIQCASLIALIVYVIQTWEIASATKKAAEASETSAALSKEMIAEMKAARLQEIAPHVIVFIDMPHDDNWMLYFVIKNTGRTIARDIKIKFDPPLMTGIGEKVRPLDIYLLREGISSLAPGQEIRTPLDAFSAYTRDKLPTVYKASLTYFDGLQPERIETNHVIDLSMFDDLLVLQRKDEQDLIKAVEELARSNKEASGYFRDIAKVLLRGIWLRNPELYNISRKTNFEQWRVDVLTKLTEVKLLWTAIYAGKFERRGKFIEDLQSRLAIVGAQILLLTSGAPANVPADLKASLTDVSKKLGELSETRFFLGREPYLEFNNLGDEAITLIDSIILSING